ncbi:hypothetical protein PWG71_25415 [Nocardiopsis sp. N85]|uniref:hypothetical protein n=1 Tax=Nocardiopsis sp. N85 TaxID=3029400 RepID=UPI00237F6F91|nr:hypothetical protein [Nocardiopsis sp. N85]MDE3724739.1 hypothetical protein [Nocardiopsis sp. N85]
MNGIHLDDLLEAAVEALDLSGAELPSPLSGRVSAVRTALEHTRRTGDAHEAVRLLDLALEAAGGGR